MFYVTDESPSLFGISCIYFIILINKCTSVLVVQYFVMATIIITDIPEIKKTKSSSSATQDLTLSLGEYRYYMDTRHVVTNGYRLSPIDR